MKYAPDSLMNFQSRACRAKTHSLPNVLRPVGDSWCVTTRTLTVSFDHTFGSAMLTLRKLCGGHPLASTRADGGTRAPRQRSSRAASVSGSPNDSINAFLAARWDSEIEENPLAGVENEPLFATGRGSIATVRPGTATIRAMTRRTTAVSSTTSAAAAVSKLTEGCTHPSSPTAEQAIAMALSPVDVRTIL